jgi:hypothetical protein
MPSTLEIAVSTTGNPQKSAPAAAAAGSRRPRRRAMNDSISTSE